MPEYIASGSHLFRNEKYRFLILPRFNYDLHSVLKVHKRMDQKNLLVVASQILDILQHLHDNGYVHSDIKAENLMVGNPADHRRRRQLRDAAMSAAASSMSSASSTTTLSTKAPSTVKIDDLHSDANGGSRNGKFTAVEYSGSNPVRRCRFKSSFSHETSQNYTEMVSSHYLRPLKQINYNDDSEASSDAFNSKALRPPAGVPPPPPDVYNSNSNISMVSSSSSGISSIANHLDGGSGRGRPGHLTLRNQLANGRNGRSNTTTTNSKGFKEDKRPAKNRFRIISESNEEEEDDDDEEAHFNNLNPREPDRLYLIDFGLASKYVDSTGLHRPFFMDERRAHDGTLEFTSRDAHLGAHARRSDLECLGYNLICWSQGNLPWRNEKLLQQPEEVHHMKEFFMSNVKETMKLCYGPQVPKYLGVYMDYVNQLMYTDRPDYDYCRSIFRNEFKRLGYNLKDAFHLDLEQYRSAGVGCMLKPKVEETPPPQRGAVNGVRAARRNGRLKNGGPIAEKPSGEDGVDGGPQTPQCNEQLLAKFGLMVPSMKDTSSKISPKNLRSKKPVPKKKRRKMSWEELLASDPEQIARQRIEKEFDEQDSNLELSVKYQGNPTYSILELENKLNNTLTSEEQVANGGDASLVNGGGVDDSFLEVSPIKGYTKPMMDIVRRRHSNLMRSLIERPNEEEDDEAEDDEDEEGDEEEDAVADCTLKAVVETTTAKRSPILETVHVPATTTPTRRKAGLRPHVKPTSKSLFYHKNLLKQKLMDAQKQEKRRQRMESSTEEESHSNSSSSTGRETVREKKRSSAGSSTRKRYEDDEDWDFATAEPEIDENMTVDEDDRESEVVEEADGTDVEDEVEEKEDEDEDNDVEEDDDEDGEDEEEDEELMSDSGSEESNSCDRGLEKKRNTRLTRWNGGNGGVHAAASSRFTERAGKAQRMITRG